MNIDALVELIYQEIVQRAASQLPHACIIADQLDKELEQILQDSYQLQYFSKENRLKDYELIVIPELTVTMLSNLANGIGSTEEEQFILSNLLQGKKVVVLQNGVQYHGYKGTSPVLLYKVYEEYERKLKGYSVLFLQKGELLEKSAKAVAEEESVQMAPNSIPSDSVLTKKLISESDLQKLYLQKITEITVGKNSIITPLAQDYIRTHQLTITRERGNT